jgi:hypothetical protein
MRCSVRHYHFPADFGTSPVTAAPTVLGAAAAAAAEAEAAAAVFPAGIGSPVLLFTPNTFAKPCSCACVHDARALSYQHTFYH